VRAIRVGPHAVLGESASRSLLYVAMTRGRATNAAYLYQRTVEQEYGQRPTDGTHVPQRGISSHAGELIRAIIANHDDPAVTAHDYAAHTPAAALPERVRSLLKRRMAATHRRNAMYQVWQTERQDFERNMGKAHEKNISRTVDRSTGSGIEL
jgi:hypothetical protein